MHWRSHDLGGILNPVADDQIGRKWLSMIENYETKPNNPCKCWGFKKVNGKVPSNRSPDGLRPYRTAGNLPNEAKFIRQILNFFVAVLQNHPLSHPSIKPRLSTLRR